MDDPSQNSYVLEYRLRSSDFGDPHRPVTVDASPQEVEHFVHDGFLVRERLFEAHLERLRSALDEVVATEYGELGRRSAVQSSRQYGGLYVWHLMNKHPTFLELLSCQPIISVIRAVLGPQVQVRGTWGRIAYPGEPNQETHWHFHQRVIPEPLPPFFCRPHIVDALIYLDDVNDANGPLCVVPGSHQWIEEDLADDDYLDKPGQRLLHLAAGSCVLVHGSLWHRAMPTRRDGTIRRTLLVGFGPTWMKRWSQEEPMSSPLTEALLADADQETRELLGTSGWT